MTSAGRVSVCGSRGSVREPADGPAGSAAVSTADITPRDVATIVNVAINEGASLHELLEWLSHRFEETYKGRAKTVARSESQVAYNSASVLGYGESGKISHVELLDNPDHDTEPGSDGLTCAQRNGLIVPLGQAQVHIDAEHPNGTLAVVPVLVRPLGE